MKKFLDLNEWNAQFYLGVFIFLLGLNLLSPKGLIHWILLKQETHRLEMKVSEKQSELAKIKARQEQLLKSDTVKMRAIREELGLLKENEISVEFTSSKK